MDRADDRSRWLLIGGAAVVALGSLLPWATVSAGFLTVTKAGTDGDGVITLVLALVVGGLALAKWKVGWGRGVVVTSLLLGLLILAIAVIDTIDVATTSSEGDLVEVRASVGIGLWLTLLGSIAMVAGAIWEMRSKGTSNPSTIAAGRTPPPPAHGYPTSPPTDPDRHPAPPSSMPTLPPAPPPPPGHDNRPGSF